MSENFASPEQQKSLMRAQASRRRKSVAVEVRDAGRSLAAHIVASAKAFDLADGGKICSVYWPMGSEIDTRPLMEALESLGHQVCLPVVERKTAPLIFRKWSQGDDLVAGGFGTSIPGPDAPSVTPDVLFVPLLAFDRAGYRLGYGGGFYDRTLEKLRAKAKQGTLPCAIGVAFSAQEVDTIPRDGFDQVLDWIATEAGMQKREG